MRQYIPSHRWRFIFCALLVCLVLALLAACAQAACTQATPVRVTSTPHPTLTQTPSPSPFPSPTPTATPIPPLTPLPVALVIHWPRHVSALQLVTVQAELIPPPGVSVTASVSAAVIDPERAIYRSFDLVPGDGNLYAEPFQLPLEPMEGAWQMVMHVRSALEVQGPRELTFRPVPIQFRDLSGVVHEGASLHVPQAFAEVSSEGDAWAGGRTWRYGGGEIELWWAPGPTEPLLINNAVVMLEATHNSRQPPRVSSVQTIDWRGRAAFLFREEWPADSASEREPAEVVVVQGTDYWLYALRVRAIGGQEIPALLRQVWRSFELRQ